MRTAAQPRSSLLERWAADTKQSPLWMKKDGREKDTDAQRWGRRIDYRRRAIPSVPVTAVVITTSSVLVTAVVIPTPSVFVTAVVIPAPSVLVTVVVIIPPTIMAVMGESRHHVHAADHYG